MLIEKNKLKIARKRGYGTENFSLLSIFPSRKKTGGVISGSLTISPISAGGVKRGAAIRKI